jgi:hypothetical protein
LRSNGLSKRVENQATSLPIIELFVLHVLSESFVSVMPVSNLGDGVGGDIQHTSSKLCFDLIYTKKLAQTTREKPNPRTTMIPHVSSHHAG